MDIFNCIQIPLFKQQMCEIQNIYFDRLCIYLQNKPNKLSTIALEMFYELIPSLDKRKLQEEIIYIEHVWPSIFQNSLMYSLHLQYSLMKLRGCDGKLLPQRKFKCKKIFCLKFWRT